MRLSNFVPSEYAKGVVNELIAAGEVSDYDALWDNERHALAYAAQLKQERDSLARRVEALERQLEATCQ